MVSVFEYDQVNLRMIGGGVFWKGNRNNAVANELDIIN